MKKNKRILFVGMSDSIHTVRWISQLHNSGWDVYLFPVQRLDPNPFFYNITLFGGNPWRPSNLDKSNRYKMWTSAYFLLDGIEGRIKNTLITKNKEKALLKVIKSINPDIVHSLEFQHSGYFTLRTRNLFDGKFPIWIATNWGSDLYLFGRFPEHQEPIREILQSCDYYSCECQRDIRIAQSMGLTAQILPVLPNAGGINLADVIRFRQDGLISKRKHIIVKGYQSWAGRALIAIQALRLCQDILHGYTILFFVAGVDTEIAARLFSYDTGIPIEIIPKSSHDEILKQFGKARIYIGLSISDGISTSLLEAMVMGAFPIQSCTACADEWIEDTKSGFIVPPENPNEIADAIRGAILNDELVDNAAEINLKVARQRLDSTIIKKQVIEIYEKIYKTIKNL